MHVSNQSYEDEVLSHEEVGEALKVSAARLTASFATDAEDLSFLLDALGIKEAAQEAATKTTEG